MLITLPGNFPYHLTPPALNCIKCLTIFPILDTRLVQTARRLQEQVFFILEISNDILQQSCSYKAMLNLNYIPLLVYSTIRSLEGFFYGSRLESCFMIPL